LRQYFRSNAEWDYRRRGEDGEVNIFYFTSVARRALLIFKTIPAFLSADPESVSSGYFHVAGIPLLQGREFSDDDRAQSYRY
jgi:hypothetical protein